MAEATGTVTNWDSKTTSKKLLENIGSFSPVQLFKYVPSAADDTAGTVDITLPGMSTIVGWIADVYESGVKDANNDITITSSGGVLTIADGSNWTLATTSVIYLIVFGKPNA